MMLVILFRKCLSNDACARGVRRTANTAFVNGQEKSPESRLGRGENVLVRASSVS